MSTNFFAMISRMKYINRWSLMKNSRPENLSEHSLEVSIIAHALVLLHNKRFGGALDAERIALLGLYHDAPEILTGDLPTPIKYFNESMREAYSSVEENACSLLLSMLPEDLKGEYEQLFTLTEKDKELRPFIKAADKISALIKCIDEKNSGNSEFDYAAASLEKQLSECEIPAVACFLSEFLPAYNLTLDELKIQ